MKPLRVGLGRGGGAPSTPEADGVELEVAIQRVDLDDETTGFLKQRLEAARVAVSNWGGEEKDNREQEAHPL